MESHNNKNPDLIDTVNLEDAQLQLETEIKIGQNISTVAVSEDGLTIAGNFYSHEEGRSADLKKLSGVYCNGTEFFDFQEVRFLNSAGMAVLIDLIKSLFEIGVEVKFVNVRPEIEKKLTDAGLGNFTHNKKR
jgi:hypothetical protein